MALYVGSSEKLKLTLDGVTYRFNIFSEVPITNGIRLFSSDDCVLMDSKRMYLTTKKDGE